jgi:lysophospholipase L1-like esterase
MSKKDWHDSEFKTLVTLGESTTAGGWASNPQRIWANLLAQMINDFQRGPVHLINVGIGSNVLSPKSAGATTTGAPTGMERLGKHVFPHEPDLLIISYGLNDANGGTPLDVFCEELRAIVAMVREVIQPLIVLPGPYYMYGFDYPDCQGSKQLFSEFNDGVREVAEATECLYVDLFNTYDNAGWLVHRDGMHANDLGHRICANEIFRVLATNCTGLGKETKLMEDHIQSWRDERPLRRDFGIDTDDRPTAL